MMVEEIIAGESRTMEFKEMLPERSIKYMKTVIAYANGVGGKIIFGVKDSTHEVVGVDNDTVFQTMDAITNAISDSCFPPIFPDVSLHTIHNRTIIVVEIPAGQQYPYYIKSLGLQKGTFIRVSSTTRLADHTMIKELMLEGSQSLF